MPCINLKVDLVLTQKWTYKYILLKGAFIPKVLNNPLTSCYLINFDFLLSHTSHFDKIIILLFFVLTTFGFFFTTFWVFLLSFRHILLAHYLLKQIHHD